MLPGVVSRLVEEGFRATIKNFLYGVFSFGFVFASFQSKFMAHCFESTLQFGGARYISTGRNLAVSRERFDELFRAFARSHFDDALEVGVLLLMATGHMYSIYFYICIGTSVGSWVAAPFLFNP